MTVRRMRFLSYVQVLSVNIHHWFYLLGFFYHCDTDCFGFLTPIPQLSACSLGIEHQRFVMLIKHVTLTCHYISKLLLSFLDISPISPSNLN